MNPMNNLIHSIICFVYFSSDCRTFSFIETRKRLAKWNVRFDLQNNALPEPKEGLLAGTGLLQRDWVALNMARSKVARTGANLVRYGFTESSQCVFGEPTQTLEHLLNCCPAGPTCSDDDLRDANDVAPRWLEKWRDKHGCTPLA